MIVAPNSFDGSNTPIGPAVKVPGLVFVAGQTSADPDIKKATRTVLENLKKVLELAGSSMEKVVKYNGTQMSLHRTTTSADTPQSILQTWTISLP